MRHAIAAAILLVLAVPAAAVWLYAGSGWRTRPTRRRVAAMMLPVATVLVLYGAIKLSITSFTYSFAPSIPSDTVIPVVGNPGSASAFATHLARIAAPLVLWSGTVAGVFAGLAWSRKSVRPPAEFWCSLLIAASIIAQPMNMAVSISPGSTPAKKSRPMEVSVAMP